MSFPFFKSDKKPILIAHRGASGYAPENSLSAFKLALDMGARFIELDVHLSKDGQVIVIHDDNLKRACGVARPVVDLTREEIKKYPLSKLADGRYPLERVPTLEEVLTLISRRAVVDVEIKGSNSEYPGIEEKVLSLLERKGYNGMSTVSCFDHDRLRRVRELSSTMNLTYLLGSESIKEAISEMRELRCDALGVSVKQVTKPLIQLAHQRGFHVCVYTVNKRQIWDQLAALRVDAMFTDFPDLLGMPEYEEPSLGLTNGE